MAKSLKTLIRVFEWEVDQKRRDLGTKLASLDSLNSELRSLLKELLQEQEHTVKNPEESNFFYANYGLEVSRKQEVINLEREKLESEIDIIRIDLSNLYTELKKLEIVSQNRSEREKLELERREQNILDDMGLENFWRRQ